MTALILVTVPDTILSLKRNERLQKDRDALARENDDLKARKEVTHDVQSKSRDLPDKDLAALKTQLEALQAANDTLKGEMEALKNNRDGLKADNERLQKDRDALARENDDLKARKEVTHDVQSKSRDLPQPQAATNSKVDLKRCKELTELVRESVAKEHYTDHRIITSAGNTGGRKTTVGIAYTSDTFVINGTLVGGPAFNSNKIHKGDEMVSVDGVKCKGNEKKIDALLTGSDQPGSVVTLGMRRSNSSEVSEVKLQRMASERILDKRKVGSSRPAAPRPSGISFSLPHLKVLLSFSPQLALLD